VRRIVAIDEAMVPFAEDAVRRVLVDFARYPEWWPAPYRVRTVGPETDGVGARLRIAKGPLIAWTATVTAVEPRRIDLAYSEGAWNGEARWSLRPVVEGTAVVHRVDLDPVPIWLRLVASRIDIGRRHSRRMKSVFAALGGRLEALGEPRQPLPGRPGPPPAARP
jgi:ribosome-associated toxin RatA of RatAB toxin-antitoxin module